MLTFVFASAFQSWQVASRKWQTANCNGRVCVCAAVSHATFLLSQLPATFKIHQYAHTFRTYVRQFVISRRMQTEKKTKRKKTHGCYAPGVWRGEVAASRSLSDSAVVCHISVDVANCLHPPGSSAVSLNLTSDFCAQAETYWVKEKLGAWFSAAVLNESPSWGNWGHLQRSGEVFRQKLPPEVVRASDYDAFWIFQLEHLGVPQEEMEDVAPLLSLMPPWPTSAQAEYMTFIIPFLLSEYCVC